MHSANTKKVNIFAARLRSLNKSYWISWVIHLVSLMLTFAWFCSALGLMPYLYASLPGAVALLFLPLFEAKRKTFTSTVGAVTALALAFGNRTITDGIKLIANRVFSISEAAQNYRYDRFEINVTDAESSVYILTALAFISLLLALISVLLMRKNEKIIPTAAFFAIAVFTAYFGVSTAFIWMVLPAAVWLISIIPHNAGARRYITVVIVLTLIFSVSSQLLPSEFQAVSKFDESIRDKIAFQTVRYENSITPEVFDPPPETEPEEKTDTRDDHIAYSIPTTKIVGIVAAIILILLILFIPAILIDKLRKRAELERAGIESDNYAVSICAMFLYAVRWLNSYGIKPDNVNYADWMQQLKEYMSEDYLNSYDEAVSIWYEAAFSNHEMTAQQRETVRAFLIKTGDEIWKKATHKQRLLIKYRYGLMMEENH